MDPNPINPQEPIQPTTPPPVSNENSNRNILKTLGIGMSIVSFLIAISVGGYLYVLNKNTAVKTACTMEAKLCPDGTSVGRSGPKCEFAPCPTPTNNVSILSSLEKIQIDTWIQSNKLNTYGDSIDTVYASGTPLFNETTGKTIDKYDYIAEKHTDRPWCTPRPACWDSNPPCLLMPINVCPERTTKANPTSCKTDSDCSTNYICQISSAMCPTVVCPPDKPNCAPCVNNGVCVPKPNKPTSSTLPVNNN